MMFINDLALGVQSKRGREVITLQMPARFKLYIAGAGHIGQARYFGFWLKTEPLAPSH